MHRFPPEYPEEAKQARIQGTVRLDVIIGKDGGVQELNVLSGDPTLAQAAARAVREWRYQPIEIRGHAVEVRTEIDVTFKLTN